MRTARRASQSNQGVLPFETSTSIWLGRTISEPPRGIEPRTYALRVASRSPGCRHLTLTESNDVWLGP